MSENGSKDFDTYKQIMDELMRPITTHGLDLETLKRLYESKLVYLENLRLKCFKEINSDSKAGVPSFTVEDYQFILDALGKTKIHLRELFLSAINVNLNKRKVS